ncbi:hypothetical protein [Aeromicrobium sp. Sec7.5]|uniref:hypothetical protein n=1 Tax=Aeromicrobium sp. Sec7.5 TaxID=3121276 RepID=UPI002FE4482D
MRHHRSRRPQGLVTRAAIGAAAGLAVVASGTSGAMAEDATQSDEVDPSTQVLEVEEPAGDIGASAASDESAPEAEAPDAEGAAESESEGDAEGEGEGDAEGEGASEADGSAPAVETGEDMGEVADPAVQPAVAPVYGSQKVRIGVQQADGSYLPEGTTFGGTTMSITLSGGTTEGGAPLPDASTTCTVPEESTVCVPADFANGSNLDLEPGQTAVVTPTSVPAGLVIAPASQTVLPELCSVLVVEGDQICIPSSSTKFLDFDVSAVPETIAATTTEDQPVVIDVVAPLDLAPENGVTGVTVTSQSPNGTAEVTGDLPPVSEQPVDLVAITEPVAAAAPSGSSRIVFTPNAGFVGTTTFGYAVATQNGTLTGVATITVNAAPVVTPPAGPVAPAGAGNVGTSNQVRSRAADGTLPSTGGPAEELLAVGALLVVAGAGAMAARRRPGRGPVG